MRSKDSDIGSTRTDNSLEALAELPYNITCTNIVSRICAAELATLKYSLVRALESGPLSSEMISEAVDIWHEQIFGIENCSGNKPKQILDILDDIRQDLLRVEEHLDQNTTWPDLLQHKLDQWEWILDIAESRGLSWSEIEQIHYSDFKLQCSMELGIDPNSSWEDFAAQLNRYADALVQSNQDDRARLATSLGLNSNTPLHEIYAELEARIQSFCEQQSEAYGITYEEYRRAFDELLEREKGKLE